MNKIITILLIFLLSCGPRTGIHEDYVDPIKIIDTGIVKSISLTTGKYQSFEILVHCSNKYELVKTKTINFNVGDTVIATKEKSDDLYEAYKWTIKKK